MPLIEAGLTVVVALHLAAVYLAMMGPVFCLWLQWRSAGGDDLFARLDRRFLRLAIAAVLTAAALGGLALLVIGRLFPTAYWSAARVLPNERYWYGGIELVFSLGCFALALALSGEMISRGRFWFRWLTTLLGSANLIYHFPTLFVMLGVLCVRPAAWGRGVKFTALLADPEILARVMHHLLAALVVTGMAVVWQGVRRGGDERAVAWGARLAAAALALQVASGVWLVMVLPGGTRQLLLGADSLAAMLFVLSLLGTFLLLPRLAAAAIGPAERRRERLTAVLVLAVLLLMTAARHRTRKVLISHQRQSAPQRAR